MIRSFRSAIRTVLLDVLWRAAARRMAAELPYVIGVAGSVGKTSTKEALAAVLREGGASVTATFGNLATDTGVPLSLLGFTERVRGAGWFNVLLRASTARFHRSEAPPYWVLELSSDAPGGMSFFAERLRLDVLVYTTSGPVHLEQYGSLQAVLRDLLDILPAVKPGGYVAADLHDPGLGPVLRGGTLPLVAYGFAAEDGVDCVAGEPDKRTERGLRATLRFLPAEGGAAAKSISVHPAVAGVHHLLPLLAAAAVGWREAVPVSAIQRALNAYEPPAGRGRVIAGRNGWSILDETANASSEAALAGLRAMREYAGPRRAVAVLGTMNELGAAAEGAHAEVGAEAGRRADLFVAVGPFAEVMLTAAGLPAGRAVSFPDAAAMESHLEDLLEPGDVIYLKASQNGMRFERAVRRLMAEPNRAAELLVRHSPGWR